MDLEHGTTRADGATTWARTRPRRLRPGARGGFTFFETLLALFIVGIGVIAFVEAQSSFLRSNDWSSQAAVGMFLANEVRQMTNKLPRHDPVYGPGAAPGNDQNEVAAGVNVLRQFDDVDDLHNVTFGVSGVGTAGTVRNSDGQVISNERVVPGPVSAFREVIQQVDSMGALMDAGGVPMSLQGWFQHVRVRKVEPFNYTDTVAWTAGVAATGTTPAFGVDQLPLQVIVDVFFRDERGQTTLINTMSWVVVPGV